MTKISKKQTLINSLCSKNFAECLMSSFFMIDDMTDSAKIVGAFWIAKFMRIQKMLLSFRTSETIKLSNLGSLILFLIIENGGAIYNV